MPLAKLFVMYAGALASNGGVWPGLSYVERDVIASTSKR
jgi:hypothetical protein